MYRGFEHKLWFLISCLSNFVSRYFNVIGSDPKGRLGEAPRPELRKHARISGACFDAAAGITPGLEVRSVCAGIKKIQSSKWPEEFKFVGL